MQRQTTIFTVFITLLINSCVDQPCKNPNNICPDSFGSLFRIVSKTDNKDLLFGSNKIYDISKLKIYSLKGTDTNFVNLQPYRLVIANYDSVIQFTIPTKIDTLFIKLSNSDTDTITATYGLTTERCCTYNSIRLLNYNNTGAMANYNGTVEFKK